MKQRGSFWGVVGSRMYNSVMGEWNFMYKYSGTDSTVDTYVCRRRTAFAEAAVVAVAIVGLK